MITAAEERTAAVGGLLDAAGDTSRNTHHRSERLTQMGGRRSSDPPGASWDLLMVTVVLVRAVLPASTRVMLTQ